LRISRIRLARSVLPHVAVDLVAWAVRKHRERGFTEPGRLANWLSDEGIVEEYNAARAKQALIEEPRKRRVKLAAKRDEAKQKECEAAEDERTRQRELQAIEATREKLLDAAFAGLPQNEQDAITADARMRVPELLRPPTGRVTSFVLHFRHKIMRDRLLRAWKELAQAERNVIGVKFPTDSPRRELAILKAPCEHQGMVAVGAE
jgi:hypothetical protein